MTERPERKSVSYSGPMTDDATRHGTHNQKSHGNRLRRPDNVPGKTGLAKAAAHLSTQPEHGPERAPKGRTFSKAELRDALVGPQDHPFAGRGSMKGSDARQRLIDAGATPEQADSITKDLGFNPDQPWVHKDLRSALFYAADREKQDAADAKRKEALKAATPAAYKKLLGEDGQEPLIKSKPMQKVFAAARDAGWVMTAASGHGGYTFSSPDGERHLNILGINGIKVYDSRHNSISGVKALALVEGSRDTPKMDVTPAAAVAPPEPDSPALNDARKVLDLGANIGQPDSRTFGALDETALRKLTPAQRRKLDARITTGRHRMSESDRLILDRVRDDIRKIDGPPPGQGRVRHGQ